MSEPEQESRRAKPGEGLHETISSGLISSLALEPPATVRADDSLARAVETLQRKHAGCVLVLDGGGKLVGIFTERDLLNRVAGKRLDWAACKVEDYMTRDPETLRPDDKLVWALNMMHVGGYRNVPLTDASGRLAGLVSVKDVVAFIVDLFPDSVLYLPPEPRRAPGTDRDQGGGEG